MPSPVHGSRSWLKKRTSPSKRSPAFSTPRLTPSGGRSRREGCKGGYMSCPVLVAVDEDADVMRDVERELRDRYARHYRVVCIRSPREALGLLEELAADGEQVALV